MTGDLNKVLASREFDGVHAMFARTLVWCYEFMHQGTFLGDGSTLAIFLTGTRTFIIFLRLLYCMGAMYMFRHVMTVIYLSWCICRRRRLPSPMLDADGRSHGPGRARHQRSQSRSVACAEHRGDRGHHCRRP